jgi:hypothetical protein
MTTSTAIAAAIGATVTEDHAKGTMIGADIGGVATAAAAASATSV